jgi:shikimate dehydrogenase
MLGKPPLDIALDTLNPSAVVTDLVYVPLRTPLLDAAAARGNRTADGLGMLLHQAVPAFEKWFGVRPKVTPELRRLVEDDIRSSR